MSTSKTSESSAESPAMASMDPAEITDGSASQGRGPIIRSFLLWQGTWLALVVGAGQGHPGLAALLGIAGVGIALLARRAPARELQVLGFAALLGVLVDGLLHRLGWVGFPAAARSGVLLDAVVLPNWMALLWVNLAAHCAPGTAFGWLDGRLRLAAIIGATSGPLAYLGGAKLGAVSIPPFGESPWPLPALAIVWGIAFPGLLVLRSKLMTSERRAA
ncbi:MAG: DUF2878 domain-containing protein [Planctomycetota bacterium]